MASAAVQPLEAAEVDRLRRDEFPGITGATYLNNASVGPIPARAWRAIDEVNRKRRSPQEFGEDLLDILPAARAAVARFLGADVAEVALASNTSFGLNQAALALPLEPGDTVVLPDGEFPANVYPWLALRSRGVHVERLPPAPGGWPDEERLLERAADPAVRAVAVSFVQFNNGYRVNLDRLGAVCRDHDTWLVVDAIQGLGAVPFDTRATPVDILSCGAQKWLLSPWGSGFFYVRRERIAELTPGTAGWMAFEGTDDFTRLTEYDDRWLPDARRFEMVTLPFQDLVGMTASLDLLTELDPARILAHVRGLRAPVEEMAARGSVTLVSPTGPDHDSGIIGLRPQEPAAAFGRLQRAGISCALREGIVRLSPHCYNTVDEMARVAEALEGS